MSATPSIVSTVLNLPRPSRFSWRSGTGLISKADASKATVDVQAEDIVDGASDSEDLKLPRMRSLVIMILMNVFLQTTFFIIVSSGSKYAEFLGGSATFSGLVIGVPTIFSGLSLIPLVKWDRGTYKVPLQIACVAAILGNILYGLAYRAKFLYLILIARIVMGVAFTNFLYTKRYCTDGRLVGVRRRTTLAGWLVVGQSTGFTVGPFVGGVLYKIGFGNTIFNGYTSPGWIMAGVWVTFGIAATLWFDDVPPTPTRVSGSNNIPLQDTTAPASPRRSAERRSEEGIVEVSRPSATSPPPSLHEPAPVFEQDGDLSQISYRQWAVIATMCWFAMTCFFVLGAWEANIPIFTTHAFGWTPFAAGNLIALGGVCTFPFMLANVFFAQRVQDRHILAVGSALGLAGLLSTLGIVATDRVHPHSLFACWFLVALGFNLASTVTLSLLSKQMPHHYNRKMSMAIQYSNFTGRVTGAVWGGAGLQVGMTRYAGLQIGLLGVGGLMFLTMWRELKANKG
ncbi:MFS general substrate transporter [Auriscalpium vulgare]|uniref:MFS general substrate transporter n=1 Tax=Auriscalpium vulgare TaxID=40419 RepID=A0ACB8R9D5_9AGAM|nr:MFS general substrate transporter [Auriscalpium vulgare]